MNDCIFCKIISGEFNSAVVYENEEFKVILDRFPTNIGHVLILTKQHVANIFELDPEVGARLFRLAVQIAGVMKKALGFENMNVIQNNGLIAGQTISHFHLHLVPRYENDKVCIQFNPLDLTDEQIEDVRKKIAEKLL